MNGGRRSIQFSLHRGFAEARTRDAGIAGERESQWKVGGMADADSGRDIDGAGKKVVLAELQWRAWAEQVHAVVIRAGDGEGLAKFAWAAGEFGARGAGCELAVQGHFRLAEHGFEGADEDGAGQAFRLAGDVDAVVHAVDEVDIGVAGLAEHDGVAGRDAAEAVGCGVGDGAVRAVVGFDLDDAPS